MLHVLIEFRNFIGDTHLGLLDLSTLMVFLFPPVIMHTVYLESQCTGDPPRSRLYRDLLTAICGEPGRGIYIVAAIFEKVAHPDALGPWIGVVIGGLFTLTGLTRRRDDAPPAEGPDADQRRLRAVMIALFAGLS